MRTLEGFPLFSPQILLKSDFSLHLAPKLFNILLNPGLHLN